MAGGGEGDQSREKAGEFVVDDGQTLTMLLGGCGGSGELDDCGNDLIQKGGVSR